jgi:hypothetical protein
MEKNPLGHRLMAIEKLDAAEFMHRWETGDFGVNVPIDEDILVYLKMPHTEGLLSARCDLMDHHLGGQGMVIRYGEGCTVPRLDENIDPMTHKVSFPGFEGSVAFATPKAFVERAPMIEFLKERIANAKA